jgi:hypothetical protein
MPFNSWDSFSQFRWEITHTSRFFYSEATKAFLEAIKESASDMVSEFPKDVPLWRAQVGCVYIDEELPSPLSKDRMLPLKLGAKEGRVNPKGIPCLYAADSIGTAIAEVRPWIGAEVSVANLSTTKALKIIDCTMHLGAKSKILLAIMNPHNQLTEQEIENEVWIMINKAFSAPLENGDSSADYAPTQILGELFKSAGYDGIGFKSALGEGTNIALFDLDAVKIRSCEVHRVKSVAYTHDECGNPHYYKS